MEDNKEKKSIFSLPRPKKLHLKDAFKKITKSTFSPKVSSGPVYSPVTDLAINLGGLQTQSDHDGLDTPKRRLSLTSNGSSSPTPGRLPTVSPHLLALHDEETRHSFSPQKSSPLQIKKSFLKSSAYQRFQSMPSPYCDDSPSKFGDSPAKENLQPIFQSLERETPKFYVDEDETSQDSGVSLDEPQEKQPMSDFHFTEPCGLPPRRLRALSDETNSPVHAPITLSFSPSPVATSPVKLRTSSLTESPAQDEGDDGFLEIMDMDDCEDTENKPAGISMLISAPLINREQHTTPSRKFSPCKSRVKSIGSRRGLFRSPSTPHMERAHTFSVRSRLHSFKRNEPCREGEPTPPVQNKRRKSIVQSDSASSSPSKSPSPVPRFQRSHSETEANIKSVLDFNHDQQQDVVGDYSRSHALPTIRGKHTDLKSISADTLADVLDGKYSDVVAEATVIDCRYPYEYNGGHIKTAENIYTKQAIIDKFMTNENPEKYITKEGKRKILIFHCEFSSERAPGLARFLRNKDRDAHRENYPSLDYPEIYLLHNGYKEFFGQQKAQCFPDTYMPMNHPDHLDNLKLFRAKSKSWAGERRSSMRSLKL